MGGGGERRDSRGETFFFVSMRMSSFTATLYVSMDGADASLFKILLAARFSETLLRRAQRDNITLLPSLARKHVVVVEGGGEATSRLFFEPHAIVR
jgi:hypothetical protein